MMGLWDSSSELLLFMFDSMMNVEIVSCCLKERISKVSMQDGRGKEIQFISAEFELLPPLAGGGIIDLKM